MFNVIAADPNWRFNNYGQAKHGAAKAHYECSQIERIMALPVAGIAAKDCALLLWCPNSLSAEGVHAAVIKAWGFRPVSKAFHWRKVYPKCRTCGQPWAEHDRPVCGQAGRCPVGGGMFSGKRYCGCGSYTRASGEDCWLGLRGSMTHARRNIYQEIEAPVGAHSAKPEQFYELVEALWPRVEMRAELFHRGPARESPVAWHGWGAQSEAPCPWRAAGAMFPPSFEVLEDHCVCGAAKSRHSAEVDRKFADCLVCPPEARAGFYEHVPFDLPDELQHALRLGVS